MLTRFKRTPSPLDVEITKLFRELIAIPATDDQHSEILTKIERLYKLKAQDARSKPSPDVLVTSTAQLVGIGMVLRHEQFNVITSKAIGFVPKLKA